MYCLKCGNEVQLPNVFCNPCLEDMATCPVRSDAVIHLPDRPEPTIEKKSRKKKRSAEDRLRALRRWTVWLCLVIVVLATFVCLLTYQLVLMQERLAPQSNTPLGQNFTTQESTEASTTSPTVTKPQPTDPQPEATADTTAPTTGAELPAVPQN